MTEVASDLLGLDSCPLPPQHESHSKYDYGLYSLMSWRSAEVAVCLVIARLWREQMTHLDQRVVEALSTEPQTGEESELSNRATGGPSLEEVWEVVDKNCLSQQAGIQGDLWRVDPMWGTSREEWVSLLCCSIVRPALGSVGAMKTCYPPTEQRQKPAWHLWCLCMVNLSHFPTPRQSTAYFWYLNTFGRSCIFTPFFLSLAGEVWPVLNFSVCLPFKNNYLCQWENTSFQVLALHVVDFGSV